jgi:hypothetical protein
LDLLKPATAVRDEGCVLKKGVKGGEDLVRWNDQVVLTGSTNRANWFRRMPLHPTPKGKIFAINGFSKDLKPWAIKKMPVYELPLANYPLGTSFQPLGMDILKEEKLLYVVNNAGHNGGTRIEVFHIEVDEDDTPVGLKYQYPIQSDELDKLAYGNLNAIAVVAPNKFYVTKAFENPFPPMGQDLPDKYFIFRQLVYKTTEVLYIELNVATKEMTMEHAAGGFAMANGITFNTDKTRIYVADLFDKTVTIFKRDPSTNKLSRLRTVFINHLPDNIKFDHETGRIYAGALERGYHLFNFDSPPFDPYKGELSVVTEIDCPEDLESACKLRDLVVSEKLNLFSSGIRMHNYIVASTALYHDGILICPLDESAPVRVAKEKLYKGEQQEDL